jgi:hypothetical protein
MFAHFLHSTLLVLLSIHPVSRICTRHFSCTTNDDRQWSRPSPHFYTQFVLRHYNGPFLSSCVDKTCLSENERGFAEAKAVRKSSNKREKETEAQLLLDSICGCKCQSKRKRRKAWKVSLSFDSFSRDSKRRATRMRLSLTRFLVALGFQRIESTLFFPNQSGKEIRPNRHGTLTLFVF